MRFSAKYQRGQVLLIVILVIVVALTIGLSVISRTITTLRTTKESESSQRAFSAAEAGIEKLLTSTNNSTTGTLNNSSSFTSSSQTISGPFIFINNGAPVTQDEGADVWLSRYPDYATPYAGTVKIYWGTSTEVCDPTNPTQAAMEIITLTGVRTAPVVSHYNIDPCAARRLINRFDPSQAGGTVNNTTFAHSYSIPITNGLLMRIIPLYSSTIIGVSGIGADLPAQGQRISSTGTSGGTSRKITVMKGYPKLPVEFFPFLLFSH